MMPAPPPNSRFNLWKGFRRFAKSGWLTPILIGLLCAGLLAITTLRGSGSYYDLNRAVTRVVNPSDQDPLPTVQGPGGQDPIRLTRTATTIGKEVEFLSATLLPGRGMNLFQITAIVPGHGEVQLLASPSLDVATRDLNGQDADFHGEMSMSMGSAILLPWAGRLNGRPGSMPGALDAEWQGQLLHFPSLSLVGLSSVDGLFLDRPASSFKSDVLPDGQFAQASYVSAFAEGWPSTIALTVTAELSAHTLDLTVSATNKGKQPAPMGMGWHPLFAIPSGDRANTVLRLPSSTVFATDRASGAPTGATTSVAGSQMDFSGKRGLPLGDRDVSATFTQLQADELSSHPVAELQDPAYNLSLRVIPLSSNLRHLYVAAPANKNFVSIGPATNVPDAFGPQWKPQDNGIVMLAPGATMEWKIRLEASSLVTGDEPSR